MSRKYPYRKPVGLAIGAVTAVLAAVLGLLVGTTGNGSTSAASRVAASSSLLSGADSGVLSIAWVRAQVKAGTYVRPKAAGAAVDHPLLPSECAARGAPRCYGPDQLRHVYGADKLGVNAGAGRTVALIEPGVDPVLEKDLRVYSAAGHLPMPKLTTIKIGDPKELDADDPVQAITAEELELDAEMIHAMAPAARIIDVQTERDDANLFVNFGGTIDTINRLASHADVVSLSYGWFEPSYKEAYEDRDVGVIQGQAAGLATAARNHTTVISANGDTGSTGPNLAGDALYPGHAAAFIASAPLTTAVGGTEITADDHGNRLQPDTVWGEHNQDDFATGGALSTYFDRPAYQDPYRSIVGGRRGNTDVAMDGSEASVWMYTSKYQVLYGQQPGWVRTGGTSSAAPLFAGVVADAAAYAGHPLGPINNALYRLGRTPVSRVRAGIADVTDGSNDITGFPGYQARRGFDVPSGIGTVEDVRRFAPALAATARR